jgi:hypothetical protein
MSEEKPSPLNIAALEEDIVRIFAVDASLVPDFTEWWDSKDRPTRLARLLGVEKLIKGHEDFLRISDLGEQGLEDYLVEGQGIAQQTLEPDLEWIAAQQGYVLVISSAAFGGAELQLSPKTGLAALGAWAREMGPPAMLEPTLAEEPEDLPARPMPPLRNNASEMAALVVMLLVAIGIVALRFLL